ncbi:MAG: hypothetical protein JNM17_23185 [Archangium sp.]|nr:hypothetical protein [Archangium sp.]
MLSLALTLFVAQPAFPVPVQVEPPEALAVRAFIDDHLISIEGGMKQKLRQGDRRFTLLDDEWVKAFELVPAAHELAIEMKQNYALGMSLFTAGLVVQLGAAGGAAIVAVLGLAGAAATIGVTALIAAALVLAGVAVVGAVIAAFSIPLLGKVDAQFFEVVSTYNHGLTRRPMLIVPNSPSSPTAAPLLQFSI